MKTEWLRELCAFILVVATDLARAAADMTPSSCAMPLALHATSMSTMIIPSTKLLPSAFLLIDSLGAVLASRGLVDPSVFTMTSRSRNSSL